VRGVEQIPWLYDLYMDLFERSGLVVWRRWLAGRAKGRILEVGIGTGRNLPLYTGGDSIVGLEPDLRLLGRARSRAAGARLVVARGEELPFTSDAFDTVVSCLVFCSVEEPERGLREIARVLRSAGRLLMIEHVRSRSPVIGKLQDWAQPIWTFIAGGCRPNRNTEEAVRGVGFVIERKGRRARNTMRRFSARIEDL